MSNTSAWAMQAPHQQAANTLIIKGSYCSPYTSYQVTGRIALKIATKRDPFARRIETGPHVSETRMHAETIPFRFRKRLSACTLPF